MESLRAPLDRGEATRRLLERHYREPHRAYHTLTHIEQVLSRVDALIAAGEPAMDHAAIRLAAWFHDAVFDPQRADNENASAELADRVLTGWPLDAARRNRVRSLVLVTADHTARTPDERVLVDADLAILAADPQDYDAYAGAIRREYRWLPEEDFRAGRTAFLTGMLARDHLFATPTMRTTSEPTGRRNLQRELARLQPSGG
ncbi:MAG: metal-dependent phosphohydrolase [Nitriliruptorales bacterium]|nr:metal-dependent phosphohydrolase [Nitriliruptorales bacterium]